MQLKDLEKASKLLASVKSQVRFTKVQYTLQMKQSKWILNYFFWSNFLFLWTDP